MTKLGLLLLVALATLAATTVALDTPYQLSGRVYCDTCHFGFETNVTRYIPGAEVHLECKDEKSDTKLVFRNATKTNEKGRFTFHVGEDHGDQYCDVVLVKSPWPHCKNIDPVRGRSRVIITDLNGIRSFRRHANNMGFFQDYVFPVCSDLYKFYFHSDDM
ncbi:protein DOWNSTREAM OF FLC-like [Chenopodium quinoa]|uniref:Uncharacterized protein n=1 Tax=Chenopodium quinoa TaxID=63459 RepID=A0A803KSM1_CHEQI|nr:protein DOWNSTREAM OF FLC-like [Chenopodium quinoa]